MNARVFAFAACALMGCNAEQSVMRDASTDGSASSLAFRQVMRFPGRYPFDAPVPIGLRFSEENHLALHVRANGDDLLITTGDGAILPHEIEANVHARGVFVIWVRVPTLVDVFELVFYYGGQRTTVNSPTDVFGDAVLVWHFGDNNQIFDSTGNGHHGRMVGGAGLPSVFGEGRFLPASDMVVTDMPVDDLYPGTGEWTLSMWADVSSVGPGQVFELGTHSDSTFGLSLEVGQPGSDLEMRLSEPGLATAVSEPLVFTARQNKQIGVFVDRDSSEVVPQWSGIELPGLPVTSAELVDADQLTIGANLEMLIDEVRIYPRRLSDVEIGAHRHSLRLRPVLEPLERVPSYPDGT